MATINIIYEFSSLKSSNFKYFIEYIIKNSAERIFAAIGKE